jgi:hypothetical protein
MNTIPIQVARPVAPVVRYVVVPPPPPTCQATAHLNELAAVLEVTRALNRWAYEAS